MSERASSGRRSSTSLAPSPTRLVRGLAARRRLRRRRVLFALGVLFLLLCGGAVYELQQSVVRISTVRIFGADQSIADIANAAMQGKYFGLIPRDSTFFFPASLIRYDIMAANPDIAAVSLFRNGFTGLSVKVVNRVPIALWCGSTFSPPAASSTPNTDQCYLFDAKGFLYAQATTSVGAPLNSFIVYESLASSSSSPVGSTLPNAQEFPSAFDFARQLATLGSPVTNVVFRGDEVDDYLESGTRITYVLGDEQNAYTALVSAHDNLDLTDGSLEYVDLRFDGKVYVKNKNDSVK